MTSMRKIKRHCIVVLMLWTTTTSLLAATVEQLISYEDPRFRCATARLSVGRDGHVYVSSGDRYVLRLGLDGKRMSGADGGHALQNVAVKKDGVIATANAH